MRVVIALPRIFPLILLSFGSLITIMKLTLVCNLRFRLSIYSYSAPVCRKTSEPSVTEHVNLLTGILSTVLLRISALPSRPCTGIGTSGVRPNTFAVMTDHSP